MNFNELLQTLLELNELRYKGGKPYKQINTMLQLEANTHSLEELKALLTKLKDN